MSPRADRGRRRTRGARAVTPALLRRWPLPEPSSDSDKEDRGAVLVAGGSTGVPGALILSGIASLRAGAGKLQLAAPSSVAPTIGTILVEALVAPLTQTRDGSLAKQAGLDLRKLDHESSAVLIGPGMIDEKNAGAFTRAYLGDLPDCPLVIDAACLGGLSLSKPLGANVILTPHAGEMAAMLDISKDEVADTPEECAREVSNRLGAIVVMKGAETIIATSADLFTYEGDNPGLATSGSGDVLSGIIVGLLARGTDPDQAAVWGVAIHGAAGNALRKRVGPIGFLARELLDEIPSAMLAAKR